MVTARRVGGFNGNIDRNFHLPSFRHFINSPGSSISAWRASIHTDTQAGKTLDEMPSVQLFRRFRWDHINTVCDHIMKNYDIEPKLPPGKIALSKHLKEVQEGHRFYSKPEDLFVMLYSITKQKDKPVEHHDLPFAYRDSIFPSGLVKKKDGKDDGIPSDGSGITIGFLDDNLAATPAAVEKIREIRRCLEMLNGVIPEEKFANVYISTAYDSAGYIPFLHHIHLNIRDLAGPFLLHTLVHEAGHGIHIKTIESATGRRHHLNDPWKKIFALSLGSRAFELFKDSNYEVNPKVGHPHDNARELFASGMRVFVCSQKEMLSHISDKDTPETVRTLGKYIYIFMRDAVFGGIFFNGEFFPKGAKEYLGNAGFQDIAWDDIASELEGKELKSPLISALDESDSDIIVSALMSIGEQSLDLSPFMAKLCELLCDCRDDVIMGAARLIKKRLVLTPESRRKLLVCLSRHDSVTFVLYNSSPESVLAPGFIESFLNSLLKDKTHLSAGEESVKKIRYDREKADRFIHDRYFNGTENDRRLIIDSIRSVGSHSEMVFSVLEDALKDTGITGNSLWAAFAIDKMGAKGERWLPVMLGELTSNDPKRISNAVRLISFVLTRNDALTPVLLTLLGREDKEIVAETIEQLEKLGQFGNDVIAALKEKVGSKEETIRFNAVIALLAAGVRNEQTAQMIMNGTGRDYMGGYSSSSWGRGLEALGKYGLTDHSLNDYVYASLEADNGETRRTGFRTILALSARDPWFLRTACEKLADTGSDHPLAYIKLLFKSGNYLLLLSSVRASLRSWEGKKYAKLISEILHLS